MEIVRFEAPKAEPKDTDAMVKLLESLVVEAQAGRIDSLALAWSDADGVTGTAWSWAEGYMDGVRLVGAVGLLCKRLTDLVDGWAG